MGRESRRFTIYNQNQAWNPHNDLQNSCTTKRSNLYSSSIRTANSPGYGKSRVYCYLHWQSHLKYPHNPLLLPFLPTGNYSLTMIRRKITTRAFNSTVESQGWSGITGLCKLIPQNEVPIACMTLPPGEPRYSMRRAQWFRAPFLAAIPLVPQE